MAPKIYHNNGRFTVFVNRKRLQFNFGPVSFLLLERQLLKGNASSRQLAKPDGLEIVLCTSRSEKQYTERILEFLGIRDFVVLGRQLQHWQHIQKLKLIVDYIKENPAPGILLHLDAPDVLVTGDLRYAMECFNSEFDCDLLLGAEKNSMPSSQSAVDYTEREARFLTRIEQFERTTYNFPFQHLNAGCFIGRKESMLELFSEALQTRKQWGLSSRMWHGDVMHDDDQLVLRELHRQHYPRIQIDHEKMVFQNLYATMRSEISANPPVPGGVRFMNAFFSHMHGIASGKLRAVVSRSRAE